MLARPARAAWRAATAAATSRWSRCPSTIPGCATAAPSSSASRRRPRGGRLQLQRAGAASTTLTTSDAAIGTGSCRASRRRALRRPDGPRGRRHHRRRPGNADHHRELPAPPLPQPRPDQDEMTQILKDYLGVQKVIWLKSGLGPRGGPGHRWPRRRRGGVRQPRPGAAAHGARPRPPRLREPRREPAAPGDDRRPGPRSR